MRYRLITSHSIYNELTQKVRYRRCKQTRSFENIYTSLLDTFLEVTVVDNRKNTEALSVTRYGRMCDVINMHFVKTLKYLNKEAGKEKNVK